MSEPTRYFTAVFEWTDAYAKSGNPFTTDVHAWGPAVGLATGDIMHQAQIYEEALGEIAHGSGVVDAAEIAQEAIDEADDYIRRQIGAPERISALAAAGGGR